MKASAYNAGDRYGRLVLVAFADRVKANSRWLCRCDCGKDAVLFVAAVKRGHTTSCGCFQVEAASARSTVHGQKDSKEYRSWRHAKTRCYNVSSPSYARWGGRGIKMCDAWRDSFERFLADMGRAPPGTSIDRIDNDGDYEPGNCRWATAKAQVWNSTRPKFVLFEGEEVPCREAERRLCISYGAISGRAAKKQESHQQALGYFLGGAEDGR